MPSQGALDQVDGRYHAPAGHTSVFLHGPSPAQRNQPDWLSKEVQDATLPSDRLPSVPVTPPGEEADPVHSVSGESSATPPPRDLAGARRLPGRHPFSTGELVASVHVAPRVGGLPSPDVGRMGVRLGAPAKVSYVDAEAPGASAWALARSWHQRAESGHCAHPFSAGPQRERWLVSHCTGPPQR